MHQPALLTLFTLNKVEAASKSAKNTEKTFKLLNGKYKPSSYEIKDFDIFNEGKSFFVWFKQKKTNLDYIQINNKVYGPLELNIYPFSPKLSDNKKSLGFCYTKNKKSYIQVNEKTYGPFLSSGFDPKCFFSADFSRYAWKYEKGGNTFFIVDGQEYGPFHKSTNDFFHFMTDVKVVFSPDNSSFAFNFVKEDKEYVQFNKTIFGPYDSTSGLKIFPNNKIFFYFEKDNQTFVMVGEKIYGPYDPITKKTTENNTAVIEKGTVSSSCINPFDFKKDQDCIVEFSYKLNNKSYVKVGDKDYGPYDGEILLFTVSQDMKRTAIVYTDSRNENFYVRIDDSVFGPYSFSLLFPPLPFFSKDNSSVTFSYVNPADKKYYVKVDDKEYGPYEMVSPPIFTPENDLAFIYFLKDKVYLRIGENIYGPYDDFVSGAYAEDLPDLENIKQSATFGFKKGKYWYVKRGNKTYGPYSSQDMVLFVGKDKVVLAFIKNNLLVTKEIK